MLGPQGGGPDRPWAPSAPPRRRAARDGRAGRDPPPGEKLRGRFSPPGESPANLRDDFWQMLLAVWRSPSPRALPGVRVSRDGSGEARAGLPSPMRRDPMVFSDVSAPEFFPPPGESRSVRTATSFTAETKSAAPSLRPPLSEQQRRGKRAARPAAGPPGARLCVPNLRAPGTPQQRDGRAVAALAPLGPSALP